MQQTDRLTPVYDVEYWIEHQLWLKGVDDEVFYTILENNSPQYELLMKWCLVINRTHQVGIVVPPFEGGTEFRIWKRKD